MPNMPSLGRLSRSSTQTTLDSPFTTDQPANTKRRKSSVPSLKVLPFRSKRKPSVDVPAIHTEQLVNLLSLPTELQIHILQHLSFSDLCALRATSRNSNLLITGPDSAVAKYWINTRLHHVHRLYPPSSQDHWKYLIAQMRRWNIARHLAESIAYHIQYKTLLYVHRHSASAILSSPILAALLIPVIYTGRNNYHSAQKHQRFQPVALRIRRKLTPLLFILSHYLSSCQKYLLGSQMAYSLSGESTTFWNGMEAPERFSCYTRDQLFSAHYCWLFLDWIFKTILSRPSYAGTIERTVRGWTSTPLDKSSLTQVLVLGNLTAVKNLLRLKDYGERKKWAKNFLRSINPEQNSLGWEVMWETLDLRQGEVPSKAQATAILRGPGIADNLWTRGAARRLLAQGVELEENELHGNVATTMRFLTDMAGFDMFHEEPPRDLDENEGSDDEEPLQPLVEDEEESFTMSDEAQHSIDDIIEEGDNYWDV